MSWCRVKLTKVGVGCGVAFIHNSSIVTSMQHAALLHFSTWLLSCTAAPSGNDFDDQKFDVGVSY